MPPPLPRESAILREKDIVCPVYKKRNAILREKKATTTPTSFPISLYPTEKRYKIFQKRESPEQLLKMLVKNVVVLPDVFGYYEKFYQGKKSIKHK